MGLGRKKRRRFLYVYHCTSTFREKSPTNRCEYCNCWHPLLPRWEKFSNRNVTFKARHCHSSNATHFNTGILTRIARRAIVVKIHVKMCRITRIPMTRFKSIIQAADFFSADGWMEIMHCMLALPPTFSLLLLLCGQKWDFDLHLIL